MAQKVMPQPRALRRALDQAGNIRNDKGVFVILHHAQIGGKRREVIVRDLGLCRGDFGKERALSHVGESDQPHVRDDFHL